VPLTYRDRGPSATQIDVVSGDLVIATIYKTTRLSQDQYWSWTFLITAAPAGFEHAGKAASREIACLAVERNWKDWMKAAGVLDWPKV
jgi:uncharacterized protein YbdZ (MbtH family)